MKTIKSIKLKTHCLPAYFITVSFVCSFLDFSASEASTYIFNAHFKLKLKINTNTRQKNTFKSGTNTSGAITPRLFCFFHVAHSGNVVTVLFSNASFTSTLTGYCTGKLEPVDKTHQHLAFDGLSSHFIGNGWH